MSSYGSVVFWMYELCDRSAFSLMNAFHCEPQPGARPKVFMPAAAIGRLSDIAHRLAPPMKSRPA